MPYLEIKAADNQIKMTLLCWALIHCDCDLRKRENLTDADRHTGRTPREKDGKDGVLQRQATRRPRLPGNPQKLRVRHGQILPHTRNQLCLLLLLSHTSHLQNCETIHLSHLNHIV